MAIEFRIVGTDGKVRPAQDEEGKPVKLEPGETLVVVSESAAAFSSGQTGNDLVLTTEDGSIVVEDFFVQPGDGEPKKGFAFSDTDGFNLITNTEAFVSSKHQVVVFEGNDLPEWSDFPELGDPLAQGRLADALTEMFVPISADGVRDGGDDDAGDQPRPGEPADPLLTVADTTPNTPPELTGGVSFSVPERIPAGISLGVVEASDPEEDALTFSIAGGADAASFSIDPATGALSFMAAPDFENPGDAGANNVYDLDVQVSDGKDTDTRSVQVTVTNVNDPPVVTSPGNPSIAENQTAVITVTSTDQDGGAPVYSIAGTGADDALFSIDAATGALSFNAAPDFETPADTGGDNVYDVDIQVSDGTDTVAQSVAVRVDPVNESGPTITSGPFNIMENNTAVGTVTATDADLPGDTFTFSIAGGADAGAFSINATTGALSFNAAPDFEAPGDAGANNIYDVDVQVSDGANTDTQTIQVTVTNDNDPPVVTSGAAFNVNENTTAVTTVTATDADVPADTLTFSIAGTGADDGLFSIDAATGALSFNAAPDIEAPGDAGANNVYDVDVAVSDGTDTVVQSIAVTVDPVNEFSPSITSGAAFNVNENATAVTTVTATDADLPGDSFTFSIAGGADGGLFSIDAGTGALSFNAGPDFEGPTDAGGNNVYDVDVAVSDGVNTDTQSIAVTVDPVNDISPNITSGAAFNVNENTTAVTTVTATDADMPAETLTFSIAGGADGAAFSIDAGTGALSFNAGPDFEGPTDTGGDNVYDVDVRVSDGANTDTQSIAVTVDPVNDNSPNITSGAAFNIFENLTAVTTVTATDADLPGDTFTFSIAGGADGALFSVDANSGALSFTAAPDFENPGDVGTNNVYDVDVRVSDSANTDTQSIAVTVDDVGPTVITSGSAFNVNENLTAVTTVTSASEGTVTYSISGGADGASFSINAASGALSFNAGPDFETPLDVGTDNVYEVEVTASGDDGGGPGSAGVDMQTINVTVDPVNDNNPNITSGAAFNVDENTTAVTTVTATDADLPAETLTFSIAGGADAAAFSINATTGALVFNAGPDFEGPTDTGGNNVYDVDVAVSDGANTDTQSIAVTVDPVPDNSPNITSGAAFNLDENTTAVTTVTATDADLPGDTLTFSIAGGVDGGLFSIDAGTGALSFNAGPDFEIPGDTGGNNVYDVDVAVSDGANTDTQSIAVTVDPVNDNNPAITSGAAFNVNENTTAVTTVTATDADMPAETLTFSIAGGVDAAAFSIDAGTGALSFNAGPDFEIPGDNGGNNVYDVDVAVSDGTNTDTQSITVTVDPVNDNNPAITSGAAFNVNENTTAVTTVTATDTDMPAETLTFSIAGGADGAAFSIDAGTGALSFNAGPDFEGPTDTGGDNVYDVDVRVSDGANTATQSVAVTVDAVNDNNPNITSTAFNLFENTTAAGTVLATDSDLPGDTFTFSIAGASPDNVFFTIDANTGALSFSAAPDFENALDAGADNTYDVDVAVSDGANTDTQSIAVTVDDVGPMMITSGSAFNVNENTAAVTTVTAVGEVPPIFAIAGTGADDLLFSIDAASGVLSFIAAPDFETPLDTGGAAGDNVYEVDVQASGAGTDTQTISVTVDGLNDNNPSITSTAFTMNEEVMAVGTVLATDADLPAETLTFSIASSGPDDLLFSIDAATGALSFNFLTPDFEVPSDTGGNNVYDVDVAVSDGTNTDTQSIAITVDPINDNNPVITSGAAFNVNENATAVTTVTATDADLPGDTLTFSIAGGADGGLFSIDAGTGALSFNAGPDFETPGDTGGNNVYDVDVAVSDGANTDTQSIAVTVDPVNDNNPAITSGAAFNVNENTTAVTTVTATDADMPAETLTFSIAGGADGAAFSIDAGTGALSFNAGPDFEGPTDTGGDNVYDVDVAVSDGTNTDTQSITVTVDPVNDNNPAITSGAAFNVNENTTAVTTVTATDTDMPAETLTFSIAGGADGAAFSIDAGTGALSFNAGPDFEGPTVRMLVAR